MLEISIDGTRVGMFTLPGDRRARRRGRRARSRRRHRRRRRTQAAGASGDLADSRRRPRDRARSARRATGRTRAWNLRVPVKAGQRDVVVTFLNRTSALDETPRLPFLRPYPAGVNIPETRLGAHLRSVEIVGPLRRRPDRASRQSRRASSSACRRALRHEAPSDACAQRSCRRWRGAPIAVR